MQAHKIIMNYYNTRGRHKYVSGKRITHTQHAIQAYRWMDNRGYPNYMRLSGFLHDIGCLTPPSDTMDSSHNITGRNFLKMLKFPKNVHEPIYYHVIANRWMISAEPENYHKLSEVSRVNFYMQGGWMSFTDMEQFRENPYFNESIILHMCDIQSKDENIQHDFTDKDHDDIRRDFEEILASRV
jgi:predicted HD phosphohydrolase